MHMILDGENWKEAIGRHAEAPCEPFIRQVLDTYRGRGITYLRDGGDRWGAGQRARELAAQYGITYRTPLAPLCKEGHYGAFIGTTFRDMNEYAALVCAHKRAGADFIKIMISGLMDFDNYGVLTESGLGQWEIRQMVSIAHDAGLSVMAHANGARTVETAALAGVDSVEHGAYLDEEALAAMVEGGTVWVPTLSTVGNLRGKGRFNEEAVEKILNSALANVAAFARMGGLLAPGTDAGAWAVPHGCCTEEALFAMAGVSEENLTRGADVIRQKF